jgi:glycosyltransferase involved in cell wall biosynthesis
LAASLVSVVTPSYNYGRYIEACLASVRRQSHQRIEHIVLDACSTDESRNVISAFQGTYDLHAFFERDSGQADALNKGFARARGDVFCWLNADDFWLTPDVVRDAVAAIDRGADVVTASGTFVDPGGTPIGPCPSYGERLVRELPYHDTVLQPATFWRRTVHRPLRAELHYAFDWALFLEMLREGARFAALPDAWAAYRVTEAGKTASDPARRKAEIATLLREQWGRASAQYLWAAAVWAGYALSERLRWNWLRVSTRWVNIQVGNVTRHRVFSC